MNATARPSRYSVHPSVEKVRQWLASLEEKTGRALPAWLDLIQKEGPATEKERREWLKAKHKFGTNSAAWLAERAAGKGGEDDDPEAYLAAAESYVEEMFSGAKATLRPIYERLLEAGLSLGDGVKACPCQTMVPLYRTHVFAQLKPTTRTRLDLGLALRDLAPTGRLLSTGGYEKKDRITHRIPIGGLAEIDDEVLAWLRKAYEMNS